MGGELNMKMRSNQVRRLGLFIFFCMIFSLPGAQKLTSNEKEMFTFLNKIQGTQKLAIYHNGSDSTSNKSCDSIMNVFIAQKE